MPTLDELLAEKARRAQAAAPSQGPSLDELEAEQARRKAAAAEKPSLGQSAFRGSLEGSTFNLSSELAAGIGAGLYGAAKGVRSALPGGVPEGSPGVLDVYRRIRNQLEGETEAARKANPKTFFASALGAGLIAPNPLSKIQALNEGSLVMRGLKQGIASGALSGFGASGADVTQGEFGQALLDTIKGGVVGGTIGAGAGKIGQKLEERAAAARGRAADAAEATRIEQEAAARPAQVAAREEQIAAAKTAAEAEQKLAQEMENAAAQAPTKDKALILAGLEGKQKALGGSVRARERAQQLFDEPLPGGQPGQGLLTESMKLSAPERVSFAGKLRSAAGEELGQLRDALAQSPEAVVSPNAIFEEVADAVRQRGAPTRLQRRTLTDFKSLLKELSGDDQMGAVSIRAAVKNLDDRIRYGSESKVSSLIVLRQARQALVDTEKRLVEEHLGPEAADAYNDALRRYSLFSDLELGARQILARVNAGKRPINFPKPAKIPRAEVAEPPPVPEVAGADRLGELRKAFEPSPGRQLAAKALEATGGAVGAGAGIAASHALGGGFGTGSFAAFAGGGTGRQIMKQLVTKRLLQMPTLAALEARAQAATARAGAEGAVLRGILRTLPRTAARGTASGPSAGLEDLRSSFQLQRRADQRENR